MRAAIRTRYGSPDVVQVRELRKPEPAPDEVRVRVHATTVSRTDCGMLRGQPALFIRPTEGILRPRHSVLGMDFAGTIDAIGSAVTLYQPEEPVFGMSPKRFGAHAEYVCVPETGNIATMPAGLSFDEAVICEGAWYANANLRHFGLGKGHNILIYGASGAIGTAAVQLARYYGATVTAVVATQHVTLAKTLGADKVIDYTEEDFTDIGEKFDCVFDAVGKTSFFRCRKLLKPTGAYSATDLGAWWQNIFLSAWFSIRRSNRVAIPIPKDDVPFVPFLRQRMEAQELRGVFDRQYSLDDIAEAYRYVETAQKTGIVVIRVDEKNDDQHCAGQEECA